MVAIWSVWYNFIRIHKTLRITPAMAAGLSQTVMDWSDFVEAMDADTPTKSAAPTKKRRPNFQTETLPSFLRSCSRPGLAPQCRRKEAR